MIATVSSINPCDFSGATVGYYPFDQSDQYDPSYEYPYSSKWNCDESGMGVVVINYEDY